MACVYVQKILRFSFSIIAHLEYKRSGCNAVRVRCLAFHDLNEKLKNVLRIRLFDSAKFN